MFKVSDEIVPVPPGAGTRGKAAIYPFAQMEVGQHFDAPRDMGKAASGNDARQNSIISCSRGYSKKHNPTAKFTIRVIDENTIRCWRIA